MNRYFCPWARLGGPMITANVLITVIGGKIVEVQSGITEVPDGTERHRGIILPGLQRSLPRLSQSAPLRA